MYLTEPLRLVCIKLSPITQPILPDRVLSIIVPEIEQLLLADNSSPLLSTPSKSLSPRMLAVNTSPVRLVTPLSQLCLLCPIYGHAASKASLVATKFNGIHSRASIFIWLANSYRVSYCKPG